MKNIISSLFIICLLTLTCSFSKKPNNQLAFFAEGECEFVVSKTANLSFLPKDVKIVANGDNLILTVNARLANYMFSKLSNFKGYVFKFKSNFDEFKKAVKFKYFKDNSFLNQNHYYAFSSQFDNFVFIDGKKVNMHIVEKEDVLIVGFPIILTSY